MNAARHAVITGTGSYVPSRVVTNAELERVLGTSVEPFVSETLGIRERRFSAPHESTVDLCEPAARQALAAAALRPEDIDLLIVATDTPEYISPATSSVLHGRLGTVRAGTFDVNCGCAGYVTALDIAAKYLTADARYSRILVVAAYAMSKYLDLHDKKTATIFADGAGATVVEVRAEPGVLASELFADGRYCEGMGIFAGGTAEPITAEILARGERNRLRFVEKYPRELNEEGWPRIVRSVLARAGRRVDEVDQWLWTQVNRSTIEVVMAHLGVPMSRAHTVMHKWGYTGAACIPMALDDAVRGGRVAQGDLLVLTGSGAGLAMGCVALTWQGAAEGGA
ncbi:MAG: ketoacyl-ACP synthase III [Gemmatimonadetes bacterium]|nr:ketoacyl-ACP synthase III [Gemmatimonadota bacterium]MCC6773700.1 ketoacyl-ACP synthase III [Gemmatimonadaceae bacterium]